MLDGNRKSQKLVSLVENDRKSFLKVLGVLSGNRKSQKLVSLTENDRKSFLKDLGMLESKQEVTKVVSFLENGRILFFLKKPWSDRRQTENHKSCLPYRN